MLSCGMGYWMRVGGRGLDDFGADEFGHAEGKIGE